MLARLAALVDEAVEAAGVDDDKILGAGIGAPGPLDLRSGTLLNILHPRSWTNLPLAEAVAAALKLRVIMDNDATAAALGEHWRGVGEGAEDFIYLYLGTGIGGGLVLDGQAYRGLRGNTGEISHIQVDPERPVLRVRLPRLPRALHEPRRAAPRGRQGRARGAAHRPGRQAAEDARAAGRASTIRASSGSSSEPAPTSRRSSSSAAACSTPS